MISHRRFTVERILVAILFTLVIGILLCDRNGTPAVRVKPLGAQDMQLQATSGSKFAIISMTSRETSYDYPAFSTKQSYAQRHEYDILWDFKRPEYQDKVWDKLMLIRNAIEASLTGSKAYEWIWMVDYDVLITNSAITLEEIVERSLAFAEEAGKKKKDIKLILTKDCEPINAGVMFFRASNYTLDFIERWYKLKDFRGEDDKSYNEQQMLWKMLADNTLDMVKHSIIVPQTWFDAYPEELDKCRDSRDPASWDPSMFLVHFAGADWFLRDVHQDPLKYLAEMYLGKIMDTE